MLILCCLLTGYTIPSSAQTTSPSIITQANSTVITIKAGETLRVKVPNLPETGKIAIFLGEVDLTAQIERAGQELIYKSDAPLPVGEQTLTIYLSNIPDRWESFASFTIKIETNGSQAITTGKSPPPTTLVPTPPTVVERNGSTPPQPNQAAPAPSETTPSPTSKPETTPRDSPKEPAPPEKPTSPLVFSSKLNVNLKSQIAETRSPDAGVSPRPTSLDASFTEELSAQYQIGTGKLQAKVKLFGTTFQPEALRFGELQERASLIDLSEYSIDFTDGDRKFTLGNVCVGNHPLLISNLCTRGLTGTGKINNFADLTVGQISTTSIVGFDNIFGIENGSNTITMATLGLQVMNNAAGGVRLETTMMNGSRLPETNFNVGEVVDAEKSDGIGFRVTATDDKGRWKADAGFARSTFNSIAANDPQLTGGLNVTALDSVTKNAWYAETSYDIFKDVKLDANRTFSLAANLKFEQVDPQFGTLGTSITADRQQMQYGLNGTIAGATIQLQYTDSEDNIANLSNILKTNNKNTNLALNIPLQSVLQNNNSLIPTLSYNLQQTNQIGSIGSTVGGGFDEGSEIPSQLSTTHKVGLSWNFAPMTFDYNLSNAFQDNRQSGRENADFRTLNHQVSASWQASPSLKLTAGYNFTNAQNLEQNVIRFTNSPTVGVNWEFIPDLSLALNYNRSDDSDSKNEAFTRSDNLEFLLNWNFKVKSFGTENPGSAFLRYGRQANLNRNSIGNTITDSTIHAITAGMTLSF
jgi:hypothetical protein